VVKISITYGINISKHEDGLIRESIKYLQEKGIYPEHWNTTRYRIIKFALRSLVLTVKSMDPTVFGQPPNKDESSSKQRDNINIDDDSSESNEFKEFEEITSMDEKVVEELGIGIQKN